MMHKIYSIGHSNKPVEQFIKELKDNHIGLLVDLRSQPYSKYVPQFNIKNLKASLEDEGINYLFFGDKLGGRPAEGLDAFIKSDRFKENVSSLLVEIKDMDAALMCSEADQEKCHRQFIAREIMARSLKVIVLGKETKHNLEHINKKVPKQVTLDDLKTKHDIEK